MNNHPYTVFLNKKTFYDHQFAVFLNKKTLYDQSYPKLKLRHETWLRSRSTLQKAVMITDTYFYPGKNSNSNLFINFCFTI